LDGLPDCERGRDLDHGEPVVGASFPAGRDAPPVAQPAVCAFDRPAFAAVGVAGFRSAAAAAEDELVGVQGFRFAAAAPAADHGFDAACTQLGSELFAVVAAVGPQLNRPQVAGKQLIDKRQELEPLVLVAGADPDRKRRPGRLDR